MKEGRDATVWSVERSDLLDSNPNRVEVPRSPPVLPTEWTRIKRKRVGCRGDVDPTTTTTTTTDSVPCQDPACLADRGRQHRRVLFDNKTITQESSSSSSFTEAITTVGSLETTTTLSVQGVAVFCLVDGNPAWFQGYWLFHDDTDTTPSTLITHKNNQRRKVWGILCEQEEVDDCLQCNAGGYRQLLLTIYPHGIQNTMLKSEYSISHVEWTGGDMMQLRHPDGGVHFEPQRILTGPKAVPYMERNGLFHGLCNKLCALMDDDSSDHGSSSSNNKNQERDVATLFPDLSIVTGRLHIRMTLPPGDETKP